MSSEQIMLERMAMPILAKVPTGYGMREDEACEYAIAVLMEFREPTTEVLLRAYNGLATLNNGDFLRALVDAAIAEAQKP